MKSFAFMPQTNDEPDWLHLDRNQTSEQFAIREYLPPTIARPIA
jgi:hypothetical protein